MYLIDWNESVLEASIGGRVTLAEARVFVDEVMRELTQHPVTPTSFILDYSSAVKVDPGVLEAFHVLTGYARVRGSVRNVVVPRDESELQALVTLNLQEVLEGQQEYRLAS